MVLTRLTRILLTVALVGAIASVRGQEPAAEPADRSQAGANFDFVPLAKAMGVLYQSDAFFYEGDISVRGSGRGVTFTGRERVRFTASRSGRMRSDILLTPGEEPTGKRYVIISDGAKLWVHQPSARQYSVEPLKKGDLTGRLQETGLLGSLYLNRDLVGGIQKMTAENATQFIALLSKDDVKLSGETEMWEGAILPVYTMALPRQAMKFRYFVDPKTSQIQRIEVSVRAEGMTFEMAENIVRQTVRPPLTKTTFVFTPPAGHKKTDRVPVEMLSD